MRDYVLEFIFSFKFDILFGLSRKLLEEDDDDDDDDDGIFEIVLCVCIWALDLCILCIWIAYAIALSF